MILIELELNVLRDAAEQFPKRFILGDVANLKPHLF